MANTATQSPHKQKELVGKSKKVDCNAILMKICHFKVGLIPVWLQKWKYTLKVTFTFTYKKYNKYTSFLQVKGILFFFKKSLESIAPVISRWQVQCWAPAHTPHCLQLFCLYRLPLQSCRQYKWTMGMPINVPAVHSSYKYVCCGGWHL